MKNIYAFLLLFIATSSCSNNDLIEPVKLINDNKYVSEVKITRTYRDRNDKQETSVDIYEILNKKDKWIVKWKHKEGDKAWVEYSNFTYNIEEKGNDKIIKIDAFGFKSSYEFNKKNIITKEYIGTYLEGTTYNYYDGDYNLLKRKNEDEEITVICDSQQPVSMKQGERLLEFIYDDKRYVFLNVPNWILNSIEDLRADSYSIHEKDKRFKNNIISFKENGKEMKIKIDHFYNEEGFVEKTINYDLSGDIYKIKEYKYNTL